MNYFIADGASMIGSAFIRLSIDETDHEVLNLDWLTYSDNIVLFVGHPHLGARDR